MSGHRHGEAYGLRLRPELELPIALAGGPGRGPAVPIRVERIAPAPAAEIWRTTIDGRDVAAEREATGALRLRFGREASFRVGAGGRTVSCDPARYADPLPWQRFLLDTVLWSGALVRGHVALHAAAVADAAGAVAILGGTGAGKTSLAVTLLRRGGSLVSDDVMMVSPGRDGVFAHPAPPMINLHATSGLAPGRVVGVLGGEQWVAVRCHVATAQPLRAVVLLERAAANAELRAHPAPMLALEAHSVSLPGLPRAHARRRFEVLGDVAACVPVLELRVPPSARPDAVADLLQASLADVQALAAPLVA